MYSMDALYVALESVKCPKRKCICGHFGIAVISIANMENPHSEKYLMAQLSREKFLWLMVKR